MNPLTIYTPDPHRDLTPEERERLTVQLIREYLERLAAAEAAGKKAA